jgi:hypothetical protein
LRLLRPVADVIEATQAIAALISCSQTIDWPFRPVLTGPDWTEGIALRLGNTSGEILGIAVWDGGIPLFLPGEKRTLQQGFSSACDPQDFFGLVTGMGHA